MELLWTGARTYGKEDPWAKPGAKNVVNMVAVAPFWLKLDGFDSESSQESNGTTFDPILALKKFKIYLNGQPRYLALTVCSLTTIRCVGPHPATLWLRMRRRAADLRS